MRLKQKLILVAVLGLAVATLPAATPTSAATAASPSHGHAPVVTQLTTFAAPGCTFACGSGSTIGPDHALYVTDGAGGRVLRIDPRTGATRTFASGLPTAIAAAGIGGAMDVVFLGHTAYVLVTLVGPIFGEADIVGLYRIERDGTPTPIADIGAWATAHPPATDFFIPSGVQYAIETFRGDFLVTDGHHNRLLRVTRHGDISEVIAFADIVPTGLAVAGGIVYMAEAGPVPHLPETGKVVALNPKRASASDVASGASLLVDVEFGKGHQLYALSQGRWDWPNDPANAGLPASPNTGSLVKVCADGTFTVVAGGLDRPTSLEFVGNTAFVVTLTGTVIRIDDVSSSPPRH